MGDTRPVHAGRRRTAVRRRGEGHERLAAAAAVEADETSDVIDDDMLERERLAAIEAERAELERAEAERADGERRRVEAEAELERLRLAAAAEAAVAADADVAEAVPPPDTAPILPLVALDVASTAAVDADAAVPDAAVPAAAAATASAPATDSPPSAASNLIRPALRGAIGGALTTLILFLAWLSGNLGDPSDGDYVGFIAYVTGNYLGFGVLLIFAMSTATTLVEGVAPRLQVPDGSFYARVGNHRWVAPALQGAGIGLVVGSIGALAFSAESLRVTPVDIFFWIPVFTAVAFALAEAILRWWSARGHESTPA